MTIDLRTLLAAVLLATNPAWAVDLACPDMAQAVQAGTCPTDEELRYTFTGYCANDERNYRGSTEVCTDFERYRRLKNVALWESADGSFSGYVSCERSPADIRASRVSGISLARQGKIAVLRCAYGKDLTLNYRTRAECRIANPAACPADASACRASCE